MNRFSYDRPASLHDALEAAAHGDARILAGGTDLLTLMKAGLEAPERLVDISRLEDIPRGITLDGDDIVIGARTTLVEIERSELLRERLPLLPEAAAVAATPQLRAMATIAGNLLQRPRCPYYRDPHLDCWLKGGETCLARDGHNERHALFGDSPCVAVHPSDLAAPLVAAGARVDIAGSSGIRSIPLEDLYALPTDDRRTETTLGDGVITALRLSAPPAGARSTYRKAMDRHAWSFALAGVAAVVRTDGDRVQDARIVLSGVAPIPWRASGAEEILVDSPPSEESIDRAARAALQDARALEHNEYKIPLARALVRQALRSLLQA